MSAPTLLSPLSIAESKTNPRKHFDAAKLAELSSSIAKLGVLQPILVRPVGDEYELVCGHRRLRAAKDAGVKAIPVNVRELSDVEALECQLVENMERADIHPLEEAAGYHALMAKPHKYTAATLAERTGRSIKYIYDRVKLLDLTKEAQALFLADRITAGHAIVLARLTPKDQARAIEPEGHSRYGARGIWQGEHAMFDPDDDDPKDPYRRLKPVSVREFERWVDETVRFDRKNVEPVLFPETWKQIAAANATNLHERKKSIVPITYDHGLSPDLKGDERTICVQSWKRADGKRDSKTCEHSILGVIVVGRDRGQAFDVCINKDKCKTHWAREAAARKRAATQRAKDEPAKKASDPPKKQKWEIDRDKRAAVQARWEKAAQPIEEATINAVKAAPLSVLTEILLSQTYNKDEREACGKVIPCGTTADSFVRHLTFLLLAGFLDDEWAVVDTFGPVAKALGIDITKILDEHAPIEKAAKPVKAKKPKRKAS